MPIYLYPFITAFSGWLLSLLLKQIVFSKKLIFKYSFIQLIASSKPKIAKAISQMAEQQLSAPEFKAKIASPGVLASMQPDLEKHIDIFLSTKLIKKWPIIGMLGGDDVLRKIKPGLLEEIESIVPQIIGRYAERLVEDGKLRFFLQEKISAIADDEIQGKILRIYKRQLRLLPVLGLMLGFLSGALLVLILVLMP